MQKLMMGKNLSRRELKLIKGTGEPGGGGEPGGNNNPPKGGNKNCGPEPFYCKDPLWLVWLNCIGKDYGLHISVCI